MNPPGTDYFQDWSLGARIGDPYRSRVDALRAECESWRGTPFREHGRVKGADGGVDCAWFMPLVFRNIGAIDEAAFAAIDVPRYELNHAEHSNVSLIHDWFRQPAVRARVRRVDEDEPHLDGDLVFPKVGRCEHHFGFRIANHVYHIARPSGFARMSIYDLTLEKSRYRLLDAPGGFIHGGYTAAGATVLPILGTESLLPRAFVEKLEKSYSLGALHILHVTRHSAAAEPQR